MTIRGHSPFLLLATLLAAQLMSGLDVTIVNVALPSVREQFAFSPTALVWVIDTYLLSYGGLLLLGGRLGDLAGRRRVFLTGLAVFTLASLACGLAPTGAVLLAGRVVQGVGAALMTPSALALAAVQFEGEARTRALAFFSAVASVSLTVGLLAGGLVTTVSWRWAFLLNVPIGLLAFVLGSRVLQPTPTRPARLDLAGVLLGTSGVTLTVLGLMRAASDGWSALPSMLIAVGLVALVLFAAVERRAAEPMVPPVLVADRRRACAYLVSLLLPGAMFGVFFFLTQYFQETLELGTFRAGLAFMPLALPMLLAVRSVPRLLRRFAPWQLSGAGAGLAAVGMAWLSFLGADSGYVIAVAVPMAIIGVGIGSAFAPLAVVVMGTVARELTGAAAGLLQVGQVAGATIGLAVLVTTASLLGGMDAAFRLAAGLALVTAAIAIFGLRPARPSGGPTREEERAGARVPSSIDNR